MDNIKLTFVDKKRQHDVYTFYQACQLHRNYYRGYPKCNHPLDYFKRSTYTWQSPSDPTSTYLKFPFYHVRYKDPIVLQTKTPSNPANRRFDARYNKEGDTSFQR